MRPKIVALVIGIAFIAIIALSLLRGRQNQPNDGPANNVSDAGAKSAPIRSVGAPELAFRTNGSSSAADAGAQPASPVNNKSGPIAKPSPSGQSQSHEEYVEQRVGELMDLGMTDDPAALKTLLTEINNPESEIRKAAIDAVKQFGSTDAIPKLEEALASPETTDKQDIREAIEFLKLPSFVSKRN